MWIEQEMGHRESTKQRRKLPLDVLSDFLDVHNITYKTTTAPQLSGLYIHCTWMELLNKLIPMAYVRVSDRD